MRRGNGPPSGTADDRLAIRGIAAPVAALLERRPVMRLRRLVLDKDHWAGIHCRMLARKQKSSSTAEQVQSNCRDLWSSISVARTATRFIRQCLQRFLFESQSKVRERRAINAIIDTVDKHLEANIIGAVDFLYKFIEVLT
jgi:hypothetical protein